MTRPTSTTIRPPQLVAPAGSLTALRTALRHGADAIYLGLRDATNARNFGGLNFTEADIETGVAQAHRAGAEIYFAINTFAQACDTTPWRRAVDAAVDLGADAVIMADAGLMGYARERYPALRLHLSVQGSATNADAIELMREQFGIRRVVLPRVLSVAQIAKLAQQTTVELEVFGFGSLCVMAEGRCLLSSYATGDSPNNKGVCSPAHAVRWEGRDGTMHARLSGILIDSYAPGEPAGYPTLCKGRFEVEGERGYVLEEPTSLNAVSLLPALVRMGIAAIKIEGRQRSPRYVGEVVGVLRAAIDAASADPARFAPRQEWQAMLGRHAEGDQVTQGAFDRPWR